MVVNGLTTKERQAIFGIFGTVTTPDAALNGPPARECLRVATVRRQIVESIQKKGQHQLLYVSETNSRNGLRAQRGSCMTLRDCAGQFPDSQPRMNRLV